MVPATLVAPVATSEPNETPVAKYFYTFLQFLASERHTKYSNFEDYCLLRYDTL
jgi:hypothetical protein